MDGRLFYLIMLSFCHVPYSDEQVCTDPVNIQQDGDSQSARNRLAIFPRLNFTCDGRITNIRAEVIRSNSRDDPLSFQVWRSSSPGSMTYNRISEVLLQSDNQVTIRRSDFYDANIVLTGNSRIEFQSGDIVGYFHPNDARYSVRDIRTDEYVLYRFDGSPSPTSVDLSTRDAMINFRQPLIQFTIDIKCDNLSTPSNGEITSCSSGRVGVGYEGETCSFTCNTGYELTGSDTRTCQSDGSWSGSDDVCRRVPCPSLTNPNNGIITCSLGDDGVPSYEDTCSFTCNTGYELTGSDTRTCQSDGSWSDSDVCRRVQCPTLSNGSLLCPNGATTGVFEDTCTFSCNGGYELQGSNNGTCLADQSWSGGDPICVVLNCSTSPPLDNSQLQLPCDTQYQSTCVASCDEGYVTRNNVTSVTYLCDVTTNPDVVEWLLRDDASCQRVTCLELSNPNNGMVSCLLGNDGVPSYEDTCSFTCNTGYELTGSPQRTCQSDGSWSGSPVSCTIMECPSSSLPMNSMLAEFCSSTYQSMCDLQCEEGFNGSGDPSYLCNTYISSGGSSVMWVATGEEWSCERVQCTTLPSPSNGNISCDSTGVPRYEDQCSFSCDPGYELTGSSTRQCLSNGSWNGTDVTCDILHCNNLTDIVNDNALVNDCSDEFGSVCSLGCITGYMVVGNNTFTCDIENDGVGWRNNVTGGDFQCDIVTCTEDLVAPSNGSINCSSDNQPLQYQDTCTFQCDDGYEVEGSVMRQCEASGEWSGTSTQCNILHCPVTVVANSRPCDDTSYTSTCMVECEDGYNRSGDSYQYSCSLSGTGVTWMLTGSGVTCSPVPCVSLSDPENGNVTCPSNTSVFQGTCTYYCNRGYQLEGNRQTRCSADGTWSSEPVTCTILTCNDPEVEITKSQSVGDCSSVTYGSSCLLNCSSGYSVSGNGEHVCDDVNDEGTSVKWRSLGGDFACFAITSSDESDGSDITSAAIGGAVGGLVVFLLLTVLCIVVVFVKWSHRKQSYSTDKNRVYDEPSTAAVIVPNAVYTTDNTADYEYIKNDQIISPYIHDGVKMESNPSYGITRSSTNKLDSDVVIQPNPSYGVTKPTSKTSEDQYSYVQSNEFVHDPPVHHHTTMEDNPSYGLNRSEYKTAPQSLGADVQIFPNPAYHLVTISNQNRY
ncbi:CUB and sushi domain-containing protein 1-like [Dysidea avara]|uniref:CUB and sushi domain-containing protein 1-like n=1 Tax=Dysidea avara TaxID=196820 RepID=UPI003330A572